MHLYVYLSNVNGWVKTLSQVHDDVGSEQLMLASQAVDLHLGHTHTHSAVVEGVASVILPVH